MEYCVAVIEDELDLLQMLEDALTDEGFSVIPLPHPDLVHNIDPSVQPDVFLVDLMLPGVSGIQLAEQLRAKGFAYTPMIAMSASPRMLKVAAASNLFASIVAKPFDLMVLLDTITRCTALSA